MQNTQAIVVEGGFGLDRLKIIERDEGRPGPGQIAIELRAASLNYRDYLLVTGSYNPRQKLPIVPLSDGVGEITEVGEGVRGLVKGDRVCPLFAQGYLAGEPTREKLSTTLGSPLDGVLRKRMVLSAESVVPVPSSMSDVEAATLPCAALTAWSALVEQGGLMPGQTVLVQGTGGVSIFALQIAKALGARVMVTSKSDAKLERARGLGADHGINYGTTPAWGKEAAKWSGEGCDVVVEVGGAGTLAESIKAVRNGGRIAIIGMLASSAAEVNVVPVLMRNLRLQGVFVGHKEAMMRMVAAFAATKIAPVIDTVMPWVEARAALERMAKGDHFGKIVLRFD
ncbi:MAG: NAD(P)-dependent alcohol dehydrogenase [Polyangiaceae bacterium]